MRRKGIFISSRRLTFSFAFLSFCAVFWFDRKTIHFEGMQSAVVTTSPKILIVQLGRLGDFILATCMLRALKTAFPQCQIHVLASRHNAALALAHPALARVHVHTKKIFATAKLLADLRKERFDYWIDPKDHYSREGNFFARCARAEYKIGFNREGRPPVFNISIASREAEHEHVARRNLRALETFGLSHADPRPWLFVEEAAENKLAAFRRAHNLPQYFCVHLSAGNEIRYWPEENWKMFLQSISLPDRRFILTVAPQDAALAEKLRLQIPQAHYFAAHTVADLLAVVKNAELVVSPDTSVVHVAAAFDRPLLGLYSNHEWNYKKFAPLSTHHRMVIPAAPGGLIKDIPCAEVLRNFNELLHEL